MADDLTKYGRQDRDRVNVNQDHEVRYWTAKFNCSELELRNAVAKVGVMAADVLQFLEDGELPEPTAT